ncbi:MAG: thiamine transport system ATP-binding protein [Actinomycetota bacterium]|nr:thiamine transport system ATP-binding protein [Actinomycetota bacterium]
MLEVDEVSVRYADRTVVDRVSLRSTRGEVVCLLGASGSGKTSLLRAIAGLEPSTGSIRWDGRELAGVPTHERGVGFVFQDFAVLPHRSVGENVAVGRRMRGLSRDVGEILQLVGLAGYEDRSPATLSGGEAQRVALARALAGGGDLLLMDEPLGSLDRPLRERLTVELRALLHELGVAVVHVTHDQHEALAIADRVVLLRDGRVVQSGAPAEVWRAPVDAEVARFLGFTNLVPEGDEVRVLPPDSVSLGERGLAGVVRAVTFRGTGFAVTVDLDDGDALEIPVRVDAIPTVGDRVHVVVEARRTVVVPPLLSP